MSTHDQSLVSLLAKSDIINVDWCQEKIVKAHGGLACIFAQANAYIEQICDDAYTDYSQHSVKTDGHCQVSKIHI